MPVRIFKNPAAQAETIVQPRRINLDFNSMKDSELLKHFIKTSGWGFRGKQKDGNFTFSGPDWDESWNPMTRERVIEELNERKRIDEEEDGDWFDYLEEGE